MSPVSQLTSNSNPTNGASQNPASTAASGSTEITKNMFLQLLVAQLKNQDPLNPADGTQFMTQLAQFQQLEQSMNTGQDIAAILKDLNTIVPTADGGTTTKS
jgi:flagellar basal-body rod modification protein FlgD